MEVNSSFKECMLFLSNNRIQDEKNQDLNSAKNKKEISDQEISTTVKFSNEIEIIDDFEGSDRGLEMDQSRMTSVDIQKLTNKKKQYLQDAINDKNGSYSYLDDPIEYEWRTGSPCSKPRIRWT